MKSQRATTEQRRERAELDPRFGKVGISAVAAAMRYADQRKPADTASTTDIAERFDERFEEAAA